jgi:lysophospholipase L1-like esterase
LERQPVELKKQFLLSFCLFLLLLPACAPPAQTSRPGLDRPLRILPMGDSITEGLCDQADNCPQYLVFMSPMKGDGPAACQWSASKYYPNLTGYRTALKDKLTSAGLQMTYVGSVQEQPGLAHEGHAGWTIADLDYCVQHAGWLESSQPDLILLHIGSNDANYARTPEEMAQALQKLLEDIYQKLPASTEVIVAQILPAKKLTMPLFSDSTLSLNEIIAPYNQRIPGVVKALRAEGKHVSSVDMSKAIQSDSDLDALGIHPNPAAAERMAGIWFAQILRVIGQKP